MIAARIPGALLLLILLCWAPVNPAAALTNCTASSTNLVFGNVDGSGMVDSQAIVTVECSTTLILLPTFGTVTSVRACLQLGDGASGGGAVLPRRMTNGEGDTLDFQMYQDPQRTLVWGSRALPAIPGFVTDDIRYEFSGLSGSTTRTYVIHGRVPAQDGLAAGAFSNSFAGIHTAFEFQAIERRIGSGQWPSSCTSGGLDGGMSRFPFNVTADVPPSCRINLATDLDFGTVPGLIDAALDQTSSIALACTGRTPWNLALDNGRNASGNIRRMRLGSSDNYVLYDLYLDPSRTQRWGTSPGADTLRGTGTGNQQGATVYGRVPPGQAVPAGNYSDTITVTVTY